MFQQDEQILLEDFNVHHQLKFYRRKDIPPTLRLYIATVALYFNEYGKITELSQEYKVSRTFIYTLRNQLMIYGCLLFCLADKTQLKENISEEYLAEKISLISDILSLRLEGKCPIQGIRTILKRKGLSCSSIGYISELLNSIGSQLGNTFCIENRKDEVTYAVFSSDEVFSSGRPILITVDAISSVILRIELCSNRNKESWAAHWQSLLDNGVKPLYLSHDEGKGMTAARGLIFPKVNHQSDTFHAFSHRFGALCRILQNKAYKAIDIEYELERVMNNAKSLIVTQKKMALYEQAKKRSEQLINLYEDYCFWYQLGIEQFEIFNTQTGQLRSSKKALENMNSVLSEIENLDWQGCEMKSWEVKIKKYCTTVRNLGDELFYFLDYAEKVVNPFLKGETKAEKEVFVTLCKAFQQDKNYRKIKSSKAKKYHQNKEFDQLLTAQILFEMKQSQSQLNREQIDKDFIEYAQKVYEALDTIVQASSMVETIIPIAIGTIVRTYFNVSKNQISQSQLSR